MPPRVLEDGDQNQGREFSPPERMFICELKMKGEKYPNIAWLFLKSLENLLQLGMGPTRWWPSSPPKALSWPPRKATQDPSLKSRQQGILSWSGELLRELPQGHLDSLVLQLGGTQGISASPPITELQGRTSGSSPIRSWDCTRSLTNRHNELKIYPSCKKCWFFKWLSATVL